MKLTSYADYSLRVLIFLSLNHERLCTSSEISETYMISRNHLAKIIHQLSRLGFIKSYKGASGGIRLAKEPKDINVGLLIKEIEPDFNIVDCFVGDKSKSPCRLTPHCKLKSIMNESLSLFIKNLEKYTLEDIVENREELLSLFS